MTHYNAEGEIKRSFQDLFGRNIRTTETNGSGRDLEEAHHDLIYDIRDAAVALSITGLPQRTFTYDEAGRLTRVRSDEFGEILWTYNPLDAVETMQSLGTDGQALATMFYRYDDLGRELERRELLGEAGQMSRDYGRARRLLPRRLMLLSMSMGY